MQISRVRSPVAAFALVERNPDVLPEGTIASRNGSATVAPMPRRNVRRGRCLPVMKSIRDLLRLPLDAAHVGRVGCRGTLCPLHLERVALDYAEAERRPL